MTTPVIVAYCKTCKLPRAISKEGVCPGCLEYGCIVFDSEINPMKEMSEVHRPKPVRYKKGKKE